MSKKGKGNFIKFHGALPKNESKTSLKAGNSVDKITTTASNTDIVSNTTTPSNTITPSTTTTTNTVKRNPEALLDDLSLSLTSFTSTVKTWLPTSPVSSSTSAVSWHQNGSAREPRLGLGAKLSSTSSFKDSEISLENAGVFASLQLKKKLSSLDSTKKKPEKPRKRELVEEELGKFSSNFKKNKA